MQGTGNTLNNNKGIFYFNNEDRYEGQFENNNMKGHGTFKSIPQGFIIMRMGINMKVSGYEDLNMEKVYHNKILGTLTYTNKDKYTGNWSNDRRHGHGILFQQNRNH